MKDEEIRWSADTYSVKRAFTRFFSPPARASRQISVAEGFSHQPESGFIATGHRSGNATKSAFIPDRTRVSGKVARNLLFITLPGHRASGH